MCILGLTIIFLLPILAFNVIVFKLVTLDLGLTWCE